MVINSSQMRQTLQLCSMFLYAPGDCRQTIVEVTTNSVYGLGFIFVWYI